MEYKTISFTEKGPIDVHYDAKYRCCLFCPYGFVEYLKYTDGDYYVDGREAFLRCLPVSVIHLANVKGSDIHGCMKMNNKAPSSLQ